MEVIDKKTPVDYEYTIKITHRELIEIRDAIWSLARYRNTSRECSLAGEIADQIEKIIK